MSTLSSRYSPVVLAQSQNQSPVQVYTSASPIHRYPHYRHADDKQVALLSESHNGTPRSMNITQDASVNSHEISYLSLTNTARLDYQWGIRHNVSYWNAINFIFGSLCFTIGAISSMLDLRSHDHYVLTDVLYFVGGIGFAIGCYLGYYEVINEQHDGPDKVRRRAIFFYRSSVKKTINFWMALLFVIGVCMYQVSLTIFIAKIEFAWYSVSWYLFLELPLFVGGTLFMIGGAMEMFVNKAWQWKHRSLGWCVSWCNGFGGLLFFIAGIGSYFQSKTVALWCVGLSWSIGSFMYLVGSVLGLFMWKRQQFGLVYLPEMNLHEDDDGSSTPRKFIGDHDDDDEEEEDSGDVEDKHAILMMKKKKRKTRRKVDIVLYRDIAFICLYVVTLTFGVTGVSYSIICQFYVDWIKNFMLAILASLVILAMGSFVHREPERPPLSYLLWFLRFFMVVYTINLGVDAYHLTGGQCQLYGEVPLHPFPH